MFNSAIVHSFTSEKQTTINNELRLHIQYWLQNGLLTILVAEWVIDNIGRIMGYLQYWSQNGLLTILVAEWVIDSIGRRIGY